MWTERCWRGIGVALLVAGAAALATLTACVAAGPAAETEDTGPGLYRKKWMLETSQVVGTMAISPDGRRLVTAGPGAQSMELWDLDAGRMIRRMNTRHKPTKVWDFSRDGQFVLTASIEKPTAGFYAFSVVDVETDAVRSGESPYGTGATALAYTPDGENIIALFALRHSDRFGVFDAKTLRLLRTFGRDAAIAWKMAISSDGRHLAVTKYPGIVQIWNYRTGELEREISAGPDFIEGLTFVLNGNGIAAYGIYKSILDPVKPKTGTVRYGSPLQVWDPETGETIATCGPIDHTDIDVLVMSSVGDASDLMSAGYVGGTLLVKDARTCADRLSYRTGGIRLRQIVSDSAGRRLILTGRQERNSNYSILVLDRAQ